MTIDELNEKCQKLKIRALTMCAPVAKGHLSSGFSSAEILTALYYEIMNIDRENPRWEGRDRMILSKNHASSMTYPIFADLGWIDDEELDRFHQDGALLETHAKMNIPGVDFAGGSLGIGFGVASGLAYAAKVTKKPWHTYVIVGDGECYEGSVWETAMFAAHNRLSNLTVFIDRNGLSITDYNEKMLSQEPLDEKWRSFGWLVYRIDGHDISEIISTVKKSRAQNPDKRPVCIICDTVKGHGISFVENKLGWHGRAPQGAEAEAALREMGAM